MAWLDDRAWCHPKLVNLSDRAHRVYINGISYSSGMGLRGVLTEPQQKLIGATATIRVELLSAGLWDLDTDGIHIHDWDAHNGKRDERKERDRERKRADRSVERPQDSPVERRQDGSALTEVKVVTEVKKRLTGGSSTSDVDTPLAKSLIDTLAVAKLLQVVGDVDEDGLAKIRGFAARLPEGSLYKVAESVRIQRPTNRVGYAIAALGSELREKAS